MFKKILQILVAQAAVDERLQRELLVLAEIELFEYELDLSVGELGGASTLDIVLAKHLVYVAEYFLELPSVQLAVRVEIVDFERARELLLGAAVHSDRDGRQKLAKVQIVPLRIVEYGEDPIAEFGRLAVWIKLLVDGTKLFSSIKIFKLN